jgi:hypothetical protein
MVRHREIETKQGDDGADQPIGLAQRQADTDRTVSAVAIAKPE